MPGLAEIASVMMADAQRRIEVTAQNVANVSTPGYRSERVFSKIVEQRESLPETWFGMAAEATGGAFRSTGNPLDIATNTGSALLFRIADGFYLSRSAQLRRDPDGHLLDGAGGILQSAGGGDLSIGVGSPTFLADGTTLIDGQAEAKIGLFESAKYSNKVSGAQLPDASENGVLRQGMVVPSNVDLGAEMIDLTRAGRLAETGAKVFQIYDDLLGKAASKLADIGG